MNDMTKAELIRSRIWMLTEIQRLKHKNNNLKKELMKSTCVACPSCGVEFEVSKDDVKRIRAAHNGYLGKDKRDLTRRQCPNPKCRRIVALWGTKCKHCGTDISH